MIHLWQPKTCCFCVTPRTGTLILGYLGVIGSLMGILGTVRGAFVSKESIMAMCRERNPNISEESCYESTISGLIIGGVEELIRGAVSVALVVGVNKGKSYLMIPYLIIQGFLIVFFGLVVVAVTIALGIAGAWGASVGFAILGGLLLTLATHFFLVVQVCYREIVQMSEAAAAQGGVELGDIYSNDPPPPYKTLA